MFLDLQNGKAAGCLILGPDGEIIQLSLYGSREDQAKPADVDTQHKGAIIPDRVEGNRLPALQVVSSEGEELPWVIVLQPDPTNTRMSKS